MAQVDVDDAGDAPGLLIEGHRTQPARLEPRVQAGHRVLPGARQVRDREDARVGQLGADLLQGRLMGHGEGLIHHTPTGLRGQVHVRLGPLIAAGQGGQLLVETPAAGKGGVDGLLVVAAGRGLAQAAAQEARSDLLVDERVDRAQVPGLGGNLLRQPSQEVLVPRVEALTGGHGGEVEDCGGLSLAVAVDASHPLLQAGGVEGDVEVDQAVAVGLQVDALASGVGGHEDAHVLLGWIGVEACPDVLSLLGGGGAADDRQPLAVALLAQDRDDPVEGVRVLGEDDDPLIGPRASVGPADGVEHGHEGLEAGVGAGLVAARPLGQILELLARGSAQRVRAAGGQQRVQLRLSDEALLLVGLPRAHDLGVVVVVVEPVRAARGQGGSEIALQGLGEGPGAGQETLLEQQGRDVEVASPPGAPRTAQQRVQLGVGALLLPGGLVREHLDPAATEVLIGNLRLQAPHGHLLQRGEVDARAAGEATRVEHLQQGGEGLGVAVMGRGGQEQTVLTLVRQAPQGPGTLRVHGVAPPSPGRRGRRRGHVVGLVDDEHVKGVAVGRSRAVGFRQDLAQEPLGAHARQPGHGHDDARVQPQRVGGQAVGAPVGGHAR